MADTIERRGAAYPVIRAENLPETDPSTAYLVDDIFTPGVGMIGGIPKSYKTWVGLEMATAVATGTPFLGKFTVRRPGKVLVFLAEDPATQVRERLRILAANRERDLADLDVGTIDAAAIRLDNGRDYHALEEAIRVERPTFLLLDPFVRMFGGAENDAHSVARVLNGLRRLQRAYGVSVMLTHHFRKSVGTGGGQSLRGSGDFHAWTDSSLYLRRTSEETVAVTVEHRSTRAAAPFAIRLDSSGDTLRLSAEEITSESSGAAPDRVAGLSERILAVLKGVGGRATRSDLRAALGVQNESLGLLLTRLASEGRLRRDSKGITLIEVE